jgi:hypothetical protein
MKAVVIPTYIPSLKVFKYVTDMLRTQYWCQKLGKEFDLEPASLVASDDEMILVHDIVHAAQGT